MTDQCPDCGRPKSECEHCVGGPESRHDAWRELQCAKVAVTRLRLELANALSIANSRTYCLDSPEVLKARVGELEKELAEAHRKVEAAEWHVSDYDAGDSAALHDLRAVIDDRIGWKNEAQQEAGDYLARFHEVASELAEARAIGELDGAVAALDSLYLRYLHLLSPKNKFDAGKAWGQAFDELHAEASEKRRARAATGEPKEAT